MNTLPERWIRSHAASISDPFYLYDVRRIKSVCRAFLALPYRPMSIHFACMANVHPQFLRTVREAGLSVFVNSPMHLRTVQEAGFRDGEIAFAASALDEQTMRAVERAHAHANLDSLGQIAAWKRLVPGARFGIRCNIGEFVEARETRGGYFIGKESRLGILPEELQTLVGDPDVAGLHLYVGTDITDVDYFRRCYESLAALTDYFPGLEYLDFGGGFGFMDEQGAGFPFHAYGCMTSELMRRVSSRLGRPIRMVIEPGRIIGADAAWFVCRAVDVKERSGRQLVGLNASAAQFPRPLFYPETAHHPVTILSQNPGTIPERMRQSDVYGCSTYSRDYFARDTLLPTVHPNDLVVFSHAGSYCASIYTEFLGFKKPVEVFDECDENTGQARTGALSCRPEVRVP